MWSERFWLAKYFMCFVRAETVATEKYQTAPPTQTPPDGSKNTFPVNSWTTSTHGQRQFMDNINSWTTVHGCVSVLSPIDLCSQCIPHQIDSRPLSHYNPSTSPKKKKDFFFPTSHHRFDLLGADERMNAKPPLSPRLLLRHPF